MTLEDRTHHPVPRRVFLFSGHMIDAKGRPTPRFPPEEEPLAATAIRQTLDDLGAGPEDLGITEGACGGDLLFAETMLARGAALDLYLPFGEAEFLRASVTFEKNPAAAPDRWRERFQTVRRHPAVRCREMEKVLGPTEGDPYERCNLWMLEDALAFGAERLCFMCLWDGGGGDGPGGTRHLVEEVRRRGGQTCRLDTNKLWGAGTQ